MPACKEIFSPKRHRHAGEGCISSSPQMIRDAWQGGCTNGEASLSHPRCHPSLQTQIPQVPTVLKSKKVTPLALLCHESKEIEITLKITQRLRFTKQKP